MLRSGGLIALTLLLAVPRGEEVEVIDDDLQLAALLPVLLPGRVAELALDGDLGALGEEARKRFGAGAEDDAVDEVRVVLPIAGLLVTPTVVDGDPEVQDLRAVRRGAELGVPREVARDHHLVDAHLTHSLFVQASACASMLSPCPRGARSCGA